MTDITQNQAELMQDALYATFPEYEWNFVIPNDIENQQMYTDWMIEILEWMIDLHSK